MLGVEWAYVTAFWRYYGSIAASHSLLVRLSTCSFLVCKNAKRRPSRNGAIRSGIEEGISGGFARRNVFKPLQWSRFDEAFYQFLIGPGRLEGVLVGPPGNIEGSSTG